MRRLVGEGIARSKALVGVHLSGNEIYEGSALRAQLCQVLGIKCNNSGTNLEDGKQQERADGEQTPEGIASLLRTGSLEKDLLNHELLALFRQDKLVHDATATGQSGWRGCGTHRGSRLGSSLPVGHLDSNFLIYRYLGHPELIFQGGARDKVDLGPSDEQW